MDETVAAYLFLCALEKHGAELENFDIHLAYMAYCRHEAHTPGLDAGNELIAAAMSQGFKPQVPTAMVM